MGQVLKQQGLFDGRGEKTVRLTKEGGDYTYFGIVLVFGFDGSLSRVSRPRRPRFGEGVGGKPVRIELLDQMMTSKKKLTAVRNP